MGKLDTETVDNTDMADRVDNKANHRAVNLHLRHFLLIQKSDPVRLPESV